MLLSGPGSSTPPFLRSLAPSFPASGVCWGGLSTAGLRKKERDLDHSHSCTNIQHNIRTFRRNSRVANRQPASAVDFSQHFPLSFTALILPTSTVTLQMSNLQSLSTYLTKMSFLDAFIKKNVFIQVLQGNADTTRTRKQAAITNNADTQFNIEYISI